MKNEKDKDNRSCNWSCIIYPESVDPEWKNNIGDALIDCFVSPLHDPVCEREEDQRKPHYHVLVMFPSKKSASQVKELFDELFGKYAFNERLSKVVSARNYARYLLHLDQPSKQQWKDASEVLTWGTKTYSDVINTSQQRYDTVKRLVGYVNEYEITEYCDLVNFCLAEDMDGFRALADNCSYFLDCYIKSKRRSKYNKRYDMLKELLDKVEDGN